MPNVDGLIYHEDNSMRPSAPSKMVFLIAIILGGLSTLSRFVGIEYVSANAYWILVAGFGLLVAGNIAKGL